MSITNTSQLDTLKKYGASFQSKCISAILFDKEFLDQIYDIIQEEFFESESNKWLVRTTCEYYLKYRTTPTLDVFKHKIEELENKAFEQDIINGLKIAHQKLAESDSKYVKEEFLEFCKNQKIKTAIFESADLLKVGSYDEIKVKIDEALKAGMEKNDGHDYTTEVDERLSEDCREAIATNIECLDVLMDGGLGPGELGVVVAPAGTGKSWVLTKLGKEAMLQEKNVIHFSMELAQKYVGRRYDCCFTGIDFQKISEHKGEVLEAIKNIESFLKIKYYPTKTATALTLKSYTERVEMLTGKKVDMIVVDYADILRPVVYGKGGDAYTDAGNIYEELRSIAGELNLPIWTASQGNRGSSKTEIIEADGVADSYRKVMTADFIISLSRRPDDKARDTARFHVMKNRFGADGLTFPSHFNASCGDIKIFDAQSDEGREMFQKMKSTEEAGKERLRNIWETDKNDKKDKDLG
jgi:replicative DNA helicase